MTRLARVALGLLVAGALAPRLDAQPPSPPPAPRPEPNLSPYAAQRPQARPNANANASANPNAPAQAARRRSLVHHYPYPYPEYYHGDATAGFRNPGGVGRSLEYYPPGNQFQANLTRGEDPVKVASFGGGGIPDRNEQLQAQAIGIQRYNAIQGHIDRMARPYIGYGVGFFGGAY